MQYRTFTTAVLASGARAAVERGLESPGDEQTRAEGHKLRKPRFFRPAAGPGPSRCHLRSPIRRRVGKISNVRRQPTSPILLDRFCSDSVELLTRSSWVSRVLLRHLTHVGFPILWRPIIWSDSQCNDVGESGSSSDDITGQKFIVFTIFRPLLYGIC